jgi:predicted Zn-dependent protease
LMQLYSQQTTRDPSDLVAKNTVAITALLLDAQEMRPEQIALELYRDHPTNSSFVATYAFSLYRQGKTNEARQVLERLDPQQLESAAVAPCYGLLLEASGNGTKAKKYLDLASKLQMLPEERKLIEGARRSLDQGERPKS